MIYGNLVINGGDNANWIKVAELFVIEDLVEILFEWICLFCYA